MSANEIQNRIQACALIVTTDAGAVSMGQQGVGFGTPVRVGVGSYEVPLEVPLKPYTLPGTYPEALAIMTPSALGLVHGLLNPDGTKVSFITANLAGALTDMTQVVQLVVLRLPANQS